MVQVTLESAQKLIGEAIEVFVPGTPRPEGSLRALTPHGAQRPVVIHASDRKLRSWRAVIAAQVAERWHRPPSLMPWRVVCEFCLPRPASVSIKRRSLPTTRPDLDKLVRSVLDALAGVLWVNDAQVVSLIANKVYAADEQTVGLHFEAQEIVDGDKCPA